MMENLCRGFGLGLEDAYNRVKWRERFKSWKEVSDHLEKRKMLTIMKGRSMLKNISIKNGSVYKKRTFLTP